MIRNLNDLKRIKEKVLQRIKIREDEDIKKTKAILVGLATCGISSGAREVYEEFEREIKRQNLKIDLVKVGCLGFCQIEPTVLISPGKILYTKVKKEDVKEVVEKHLVNGKIVERLIYEEPKTKERIAKYNEIPFYKKQKRIVLRNCGLINPHDIEEYIAQGGYFALEKALKMKPEKIIEEVKKSGLRGRGGAGYPTGKKWESTKLQKEKIKYVICNGDEGDPGAYMDRSILESDPHSVIEGMIIAGYTIGSNEGWVYVRHEYPLAVKNIGIAIEQCRNYGLLGKNILNSGEDFDIKIAKGAGAFVSGEATALVSSIEGKRAIPRARPPRLAVSGLYGKPTLLNNVETFANIPLIIEKGWKYFAKIGTENSKGTKIFSLVGKIKNTGLVEVPMGITLREIVYDIGGGALNGKEIKAIQTGGPSGGCIPKKLFELPIDYESLVEAGSMMGSGGMIVMDEENCMVDIAKYFTNFLQDESCGKCSTCREGTQRMYEILNNITNGNGGEEDLNLLEDLGKVIREASLCGLGESAPNPVLSTLRYFKKEYEEHIKEKKCRAKVCKQLIKYLIEDNCTGCGVCKKNCPNNAIKGETKKQHLIEEEKCIKCGICFDICKFNAVIKSSGDKNA